MRSLCRLLSLLLALGLSGAAAAQTKLRFTLDWVIDGQQTPFLLAERLGYFTGEGLSVVIDAGAGSSLAVQRVASGTYDMGYGDSSSLMEFLANNTSPAARVQAIYMVQESTPSGLMALKKSNIAGPKDLAGRTTAGPVFDPGRKFFPIFAKGQNIDPAAVKWQSVQPGLNFSMLARGQVDVISGFPNFALGTMEVLGVKPEELVIFNYKDYGLQIYGNAILVKRYLPSRLIHQ